MTFQLTSLTSFAGPKTARIEKDCTQSTWLRGPARSAPVNASAPARVFLLTHPMASPHTLPMAYPTHLMPKWDLSTIAWKIWLWHTNTETLTDIVNETDTGTQVEQLQNIRSIYQLSVALVNRTVCLCIWKWGVCRTKDSCLACVKILLAVHLYKDHSYTCPCATTVATIYALLLLSQKERDTFSAKLSHWLDMRL